MAQETLRFPDLDAYRAIRSGAIVIKMGIDEFRGPKGGKHKTEAAKGENRLFPFAALTNP
jgi:hypothetical protein